MTRYGSHAIRCLLLLVAISQLGCQKCCQRPALDEARRADRDAASFPAPGEDYFHAMDGGLALTPEQIKGRNTWISWTGGNDRFWDLISKKSVGTLDFLKTLSSYPDKQPNGEPWLKSRRGNRWHYLGLVNEPCFEEATGPDPARFGLRLDKRRADCPPERRRQAGVDRALEDVLTPRRAADAAG
jgi:hypothetical protein